MLIADRYEPTGNAAWGGMSEVHECMDLHLNRTVLLKRVKKTADSARLIDEQKALLALRTKHVVELLDIVEYDYLGESEKGLILENINGHDLTEGCLPYSDEYLKVLWQVASGLSDIHLAGVIHRDIKPANIRIDAMGVVKIIDFGLSRQSGIDDKTKSIAGSFGYMAPELFDNKTIAFTNAIDVYAFGQTALSLIQVAPTQGGQTFAELCERLLSAADKELRALIAACCENDPGKRPLMATIRDQLGARLVQNRHRAWLFEPGRLTELSATSPRAAIRSAVGTLTLVYDGLSVMADDVAGNVYINNRKISKGDKILASCVIIFRHNDGTFAGCLPFDVSHPQVIV